MFVFVISVTRHVGLTPELISLVSHVIWSSTGFPLWKKKLFSWGIVGKELNVIVYVAASVSALSKLDCIQFTSSMFLSFSKSDSQFPAVHVTPLAGNLRLSPTNWASFCKQVSQSQFPHVGAQGWITFRTYSKSVWSIHLTVSLDLRLLREAIEKNIYSTCFRRSHNDIAHFTSHPW